MRRVGTLRALTAVALATCLGSIGTAPVQAATHTGEVSAFASSANNAAGNSVAPVTVTRSAGISPPGSNNWFCRPSPAHPRPVVLVHATGTNAAVNWVSLSPKLVASGYCVFAFDYGITLASVGVINGVGDIPTGARTMSAFVDLVLRVTGARQVDVVGHSQGGMMPNYYIKRLGGATKVHTLVALSPSNHGTSLGGLTNLARSLDLMKWVDDVFNVFQTPAFGQQAEGSPFMTSLFADGDTVSGVRYVVIQTTHDKVVTPYTNAFLHGEDVRNILVQDQCADDPVGHIGMFSDGPALQNVMNVLGPDVTGFRATCGGYGFAF